MGLRKFNLNHMFFLLFWLISYRIFRSIRQINKNIGNEGAYCGPSRSAWRIQETPFYLLYDIIRKKTLQILSSLGTKLRKKYDTYKHIKFRWYVCPI